MSTTSFANNSNSDDPPPKTEGDSAGTRRVLPRTESKDNIPAIAGDESQTTELNKSSVPEQVAAAESTSEEQEIAELTENTIQQVQL